MALGYLFVALLAAAVAVFAVQNSSATTVRFLIWTREGVPLSAVVLCALAAGLIVAGLPLTFQRWRLRVRARRLEARVKALEKREQALAADAVDRQERAKWTSGNA
jgi:uncharacterized integral membrane protein